MGRTRFSGPLWLGSEDDPTTLTPDGSGRMTIGANVAGAYEIIPLFVPGTLTVADGVAKWIAPYACKLLHVGAWLKNTGTTAGSTSIQVSVGATDFLTATLDIAYNDADGVAETTTLANTAIAQGDVVEIDIDAISTAPADLTVYLTVRPTAHTVNT